MPKTKKQFQQEKRLQKNVQKAKSVRADAKTSNAGAQPPKKGGIFDSLKKLLGFGRETPHTVQDTITYKTMYRDGICRVTDTLYTKTVQFQDINYQLGATRSHTNAIPHIENVRALVRVALKMGSFRRLAEATTYALMSGMMG